MKECHNQMEQGRHSDAFIRDINKMIHHSEVNSKQYRIYIIISLKQRKIQY